MDAGLEFDVVQASVDEAALRDHLIGEGASLSEIAVLLAEVKAKSAARTDPDALVIGADQILVWDHEIFAKPGNTSEARKTLQRLRGQTHELISAVALVRGGDCLWGGSDAARLTMRDFSNEFLEDYLNQEGDALLPALVLTALKARVRSSFQKSKGIISPYWAFPF